jgi:hypothetical protein
MGLLSVESYMTLGGQLIRPGPLRGRSAVVPMAINFVAWSEWIEVDPDCETAGAAS